MAVTCVPALAGDVDPVRVQSRTFEIEYEVNPAALPLTAVRLWYTLDEGRTWTAHANDEDCVSPATFHATQEGLYGVFFQLENATGVSSTPPGSSTIPHQWAFVDETPPVVQLHELRQTTMLGQRVVQIRWTAVDANLTPRPIEIEYQRLPGGQATSVVDDPIANTGRYDWRLPDDLAGSAAVRLFVNDCGGHRVASERQIVEILPLPGHATPVGLSATGLAEPSRQQVAVATSSDFEGRNALRGRQLYREALAFRDLGDYRQAVSRLREVVKLDPQMAEAFSEMGAMLYLLGDYDEALAAFDIALAQKPALRSALQGAAKVFRQKHDYASAAAHLRTILRYNPNDAETWMFLGDVGIFQGDEALARECYIRATQIDPEATVVIEQAGKRLALMADVSRSYRQKGH